MFERQKWPILKEYDQQHLARIALPLGASAPARFPWEVAATCEIGKSSTVLPRVLCRPFHRA